MKILVIHNFHRTGSASGDDQVFKNEIAILKEYGNKVISYSAINDEFDNASVFEKIKLFFGMFWSNKHYRAIKNICKKENPDVVHIHTFFPLISPSVLYAAKSCNCKVVATLHDCRFVCPCATLLRDNKLCSECGSGSYFRMIKYGCFKDSKLLSFFVACIFSYHRQKKSFYNQIDKYICLNDKQIELLIQSGFEKSKIVKKYNFVYDVNRDFSMKESNSLPQRYVVYFGRLGEEKGIRILMKIWNHIKNIPLVVMGGGPLKDEFEAWAANKDNVYYLGYTEHDKCLSIVKKSEFVIFPSIWYEGCSMVEIETMSLGKCIVATRLGFSKEAIIDGVNGYTVPLGDIDNFVSVIVDLWNKKELCEKMGEMARKEYEFKYTPADNYKQIMSIYTEIAK